MSRFKKGWLIMLCLLCVFLLTGCYSDNDPWPSAEQLAENGSMAATEEPATTAAPTATPTPQPVMTAAPATAAPTLQPAHTREPDPENAVDVSPNFNG